MTPIEARFNDGMDLANRMKGIGRAAYWGGYTAGLMRGLFGALAVTDSQHRALVNLAAGEEATGYRDGFAEVEAMRLGDGPGNGAADDLPGWTWVSVGVESGLLKGDPSSALRLGAEAWENEGGAGANPA